jgi:carbohydrate diacid regulator
MLTEKRIQKILDKVIRSIQVVTDVVDLTGIIVASSDRKRVGQIDPTFNGCDIKEGKPTFVRNRKTYMRLMVNRAVTYFIVMEGTSKVIRNYCLLTASLMELYLKTTVQKLNREEVMRRAILAQVSELELQEYVRDYKLDPDALRCIIVIRTTGMEADQVYQILLKVFPRNQGDILILMDSRTVVLIKLITDEMEEDEFKQLAAAIEDTILNETTIKAYIGIGNCKPSIYEIRESYLEATEAIDVGRIYDISNRIYLYDELLLERFLHEVPSQICQEYYQTIFQGEVKKVLTDEMITTIEKFFENSLNLSETSRQLYIHRNTLVYRLDKIQKVLGLDLRNFHDAVTFKIMMMLERQERECSL